LASWKLNEAVDHMLRPGAFIAKHCTRSMSPQKWRIMSTEWGFRAFKWKYGESSSFGRPIHRAMFTKSSAPRRPSSNQPFASRAAGVKRWLKLMPKHRCLSRATRTISSAFGISLQIGFSHSTWQPASSAWMVGS
jgi:hypothetical protein